MSLARAVTVADLRLIARRRLPRAVFDYIDGGADDEGTLRANMADFDSVMLKQRVLAHVGATRLETTILGSAAAGPRAGCSGGGRTRRRVLRTTSADEWRRLLPTAPLRYNPLPMGT